MLDDAYCDGSLIVPPTCMAVNPCIRTAVLAKRKDYLFPYFYQLNYWLIDQLYLSFLIFVSDGYIMLSRTEFMSTFSIGNFVRGIPFTCERLPRYVCLDEFLFGLQVYDVDGFEGTGFRSFSGAF